MALKTGRAGMITPRDEKIFTDLYLCRFLSTRQIAALRFPTIESARIRLYALMRKGWITNQIQGPKEILWRLTAPGFEHVRTSLDRKKEPAPGFFSGPKVCHYCETNDVYCELAPRLEHILGNYPGWEWRNESRAFHRYELGGERHAHQPDAEILLPDAFFFVERQSDRARYSREIISGKVAAYRVYVEHVLRPEPKRAEILFACDLDRERHAAVEAGNALGVDVVASSVRGIAAYLEKVALQGS